MNALLIALGGGLGAMARYGVGLVSSRVLGEEFPYGTFIVNVIGSFAMGLVTAFLLRKYADNESLRLFITTGLLGGFTTFSAFSMDVMNLMQRGENSMAVFYVAASVALSIAAVFLGFILVRTLTG